MKLQFTGATLSVEAAAEGQDARITGIAVPYGISATVSTGQTVQIMAGALPSDGPMPRLIMEHDRSQVVGVVDQRQDTPEGMLFSARIADTVLGRDLIQLLKMGALDSVSIGIRATDFEIDGKTTVVKAAMWDELSVVYEPAFSGAIITDIAASNPDADEPQPDPIPEEEEMSDQETTVEAQATTPTQPIWASVARQVALPTAVEYIAAAISGGTAWHNMSQALRAAAPDIVTTDTPGVLPIPVISPVYNNFIGRRPVIDAVGVRALPAGGKVFIRPEVTTHTSIGASIGEQSPTAGTMVVFNNQVTKQIFGGYVNISEADIDWSDPAILQIVLDDIGRIYANATDNYAADTLVSGASVTAILSDANLADPAKVVEFVYNAASTILSGSNGNLPNHLFLSADMFAALGQLSDTADRPLFPQVGPMNAFGTMTPGSLDATAFGLKVVVDRNFAAGTIIVGDGSGYELFEQQKGAISIDSPSTLSRTIAFRGYFAALMIDPTKFVKRTAS